MGDLSGIMGMCWLKELRLVVVHGIHLDQYV